MCAPCATSINTYTHILHTLSTTHTHSNTHTHILKHTTTHLLHTLSTHTHVFQNSSVTLGSFQTVLMHTCLLCVLRPYGRVRHSPACACACVCVCVCMCVFVHVCAHIFCAAMYVLCACVFKNVSVVATKLTFQSNKAHTIGRACVRVCVCECVATEAWFRNRRLNAHQLSSPKEACATEHACIKSIQNSCTLTAAYSLTCEAYYFRTQN